MSKKYRFYRFWLLFLLLSGNCLAQEITEIRITYLKANEPPAIPAPSPETIIFRKNLKGDLAVTKASGFSSKEKKELLKSLLVKDDVQLMNSWLLHNKREFTLQELGVEVAAVNEELEKNPLTFTQHVGPNHIIRPDSSSFCIKNAAFLKRDYVLGDFDLLVEIMRQGGIKEVFAFNSPSFMSHEIDLVSYFTVAPFLIKLLPASFADKGLFNRKSLLQGIMYHLKYEECEGYYYGEFVKKHQNRTAAQNRLQEGWNFKGYMQNKE